MKKDFLELWTIFKEIFKEGTSFYLTATLVVGLLIGGVNYFNALNASSDCIVPVEAFMNAFSKSVVVILILVFILYPILYFIVGVVAVILKALFRTIPKRKVELKYGSNFISYIKEKGEEIILSDYFFYSFLGILAFGVLFIVGYFGYGIYYFIFFESKC